MPLAADAMPCSRMPKCMFRPASVAENTPAPSNSSKRHGRGSQVGRAADQPGNACGHGVEHLARRNARGHSLGVGRKRRQRLAPNRRAIRGACICRHCAASSGYFFAYSAKLTLPGLAIQLLAALADLLGKMRAHLVGHEKLGVGRPAVGFFRQTDLVVAQRAAVGRWRVLLVRASHSRCGCAR